MPKAKFSDPGRQRLHDAMAALVESGDRPGIVTLVSRHRETHVDAVGTHEFGGGPPMQRDTIFRIASITKPIVAATTMALVDDGSLRLDEPIERFLPELAIRRVVRRLDGPIDDTVPAKRSIRVSDLLTMRMGVGWIMSPGDHPIQTALMRAGVLVPFVMPTLPLDAWIANLADFPLMDHPGEVWRYDTSITVLGALIVRAMGKPLGEVIAERILTPLGMIDTGFVVPPEKLARLPACYQRNPATGAMEVWDPAGPDSYWAKLPAFPGAHGGLVSTVDDYLAFAGMMMNGGTARDGRRVLSEASVDAMMTDQVPADVKARSPFSSDFWEKRGWGYGGATVKTHIPGEPSAGFGWEGGYGTCAYWDARTGIVGIVLSQRLVDSPDYPPLYRQFWDGVYQAVE